MDLIKETQEAHDALVRAVQDVVHNPELVKEEAALKAAIKGALDKFHEKAREVDNYIQGELKKLVGEAKDESAEAQKAAADAKADLSK